MVSDEEFEEYVSRAIAKIPARHVEKIKNVVFLISSAPNVDQLRSAHMHHGSTLLGLYEGIPLTQRGEYYGIGGTLPDKITLFKEPIVAEAGGDEELLQQIVDETVWHEIAHYFGYDDPEIEDREHKGTNYST